MKGTEFQNNKEIKKIKLLPVVESEKHLQIRGTEFESQNQIQHKEGDGD